MHSELTVNESLVESTGLKSACSADDSLEGESFYPLFASFMIWLELNCLRFCLLCRLLSRLVSLAVIGSMRANRCIVFDLVVDVEDLDFVAHGPL